MCIHYGSDTHLPNTDPAVPTIHQLVVNMLTSQACYRHPSPILLQYNTLPVLAFTQTAQHPVLLPYYRTRLLCYSALALQIVRHQLLAYLLSPTVTEIAAWFCASDGKCSCGLLNIDAVRSYQRYASGHAGYTIERAMYASGTRLVHKWYFGYLNVPDVYTMVL